MCPVPRHEISLYSPQLSLHQAAKTPSEQRMPSLALGWPRSPAPRLTLAPDTQSTCPTLD
ncbi:hypothetical protein E2C01_024999 [Portunus trituberculatus]|uniref:Uncharacterized protein n=1 Tax=Portunus trituberculatus TaxID=210409 RepID=A0A5B7EFE0_PORTR|nr:hypothetical protein [Portunus trituberculatus]